MRTRTVKPARPGLLVRDPERRRHLKPDGEVVPLTSYWRRRLAAADVVPVTQEPIPAQPVTKKTKRDEE